MNKILNLKKRDKEAIAEFKRQVLNNYPDARFILYGSKVKREDTRFSDIDILVLIKERVTTSIEEKIFGIGFDVGLRYDVVFGIVVEEDSFWNSPLSEAMPFYWRVSKEGIPI